MKILKIHTVRMVHTHPTHQEYAVAWCIHRPHSIGLQQATTTDSVETKATSATSAYPPGTQFYYSSYLVSNRRLRI